MKNIKKCDLSKNELVWAKQIKKWNLYILCICPVQFGQNPDSEMG